MTYHHLGEAADSISTAPPSAKAVIDNPTAWFIGAHEDSEWWSGGFATRDEAIAKGRERHGPDDFYLVEARRMVPDIDSLVSFDGEFVVEQIQDSEVWGEDGWEGAGDTGDLEARLRATVKAWFTECCDLTGAQLDFVSGPDRIAA